MEHVRNYFDPINKRLGKHGRQKPIPMISTVLDDGSLVELALDVSKRTSSFIHFENGKWSTKSRITGRSGTTLIPYAASNNLIAHHVVLFPEHPSEYESVEALFLEVLSFVRRYVDLSPPFEKVAVAYILFTWVYDCFNELPYLRIRGDYGTGKTRFLLIVGSLCYKPIFASGASTVSPLFHILNAFRGTLILDEGDFRFSDAKADIIKILNNGNVRGVPVLRTEVSKNGEFNPRAFQVFGPKIVATRGSYHDQALESRFVTEDMGHRKLRRDVPINLPDQYRDEARQLRNKLLLYRFRTFGKLVAEPNLIDERLEPRFNQVFVPLMSVTKDTALHDELRKIALKQQKDLHALRGQDIEGVILAAMYDLQKAARSPLTIKSITEACRVRMGDTSPAISPKRIGSVIRNRLHLKTQKSNGNFIVPLDEQERLDYLYEKYGLSSDSRDSGSETSKDVVDFGDFEMGTSP